MSALLTGVGVGPGDPELLTVKAARVIGAADVVAFYSARHGRSIARAIAEPYLRADQVQEALVYPITTEDAENEGGYEAAMVSFYDSAAARLAVHLDAGRSVVVLCAGDPFFYGSYMYLHERLSSRYPTDVIPGVTSMNAASAVLGRPLVERDEVLTVLPGTLPRAELAARLARTDAAAVLKLGRTFDNVRGAFDDAGRLDEGWYVERATSSRQRSSRLADVDADGVPYFSLALLPSPVSTDSTARAASSSRDLREDSAVTIGLGGATPVVGEVVVVGLGPAGSDWRTPEATEALRQAEHLVGYGPYVDRAPHRPGQLRHSSGNQVEAERAAFALDLALGGARVAVVSSGDPGVFAMASAVLEVAEDPRWKDVPVRVVPGLTAAQAAASRIGAPLGHDFAIVSLSDRLKPWEIIEKRLEAVAVADLVLAVYNPASKTRRWQVAKARDVMLKHRPPTTPVVVARDVGGVEENITVVDLVDLDPETVDMRCLLIFGSSMTRRSARSDVPGGRTVVWTPRTYPPLAD